MNERIPVRYEWRPGSRYTVPAEAVGREIDRLGRESGLAFEGVTPEMVMEAGKDPENPLHSCFTHDTDKAARLYNLDEARLLIRSIRPIAVRVFPDVDQAAHAIYRVRVTLPDGNGAYVPTQKVMDDVTLRQQALTDCVRLLRGIRKRYASLEEMAEVFALIDGIGVGDEVLA